MCTFLLLKKNIPYRNPFKAVYLLPPGPEEALEAEAEEELAPEEPVVALPREIPLLLFFDLITFSRKLTRSWKALLRLLTLPLRSAD